MATRPPRGYRSGPLHLEGVNFSAANIAHDEWRVIWTKTTPFSTSRYERSSYVLEANCSIFPPLVATRYIAEPFSRVSSK